MLVSHEHKLVLATPFGCASTLEGAASPGSGVLSIVEGVGRYSMRVPASLKDYRRVLVVRNPYERAVLLWKWAKSYGDDVVPPKLRIEGDSESFAKYINRIERTARDWRAWLYKHSDWIVNEDDGRHYGFLLRSYRLCWLQLNQVGSPNKADVLRLEALPAWLADTGMPMDAVESSDFMQHFQRESQGELRLNVGRVRCVNRLWADVDCCLLGTYEHLGEWGSSCPVCNVKHKSEPK